jgi:hypothetical protein
MLPPNFFSTSICILDFGLSFLTEKPPRGLSLTPRSYMSPESIFELVNGTAADMWSFGVILYCLRASTHIFRDRGPGDGDPMGTDYRMWDVLGELPQEWLMFPSLEGYPVHETLHSSIPYETLETCRTDSPALSLEQLVDEIVEPHPHTNSLSQRTGSEELWLQIPDFYNMSRSEKRSSLATLELSLRPNKHAKSST